MAKKKEIEIIVTFSEGWQERFTRAAYDLYLEIETEKKEGGTIK